MSKIDWNDSSEKIKNLVRGLDPIMGTYTFYNDKKIKIWKVMKLNFEDVFATIGVLDIESKANGEIILSDDKKGLYIKTVDGIISVVEIQGENSKRMNISDFLRGTKLEVGKVLK